MSVPEFGQQNVPMVALSWGEVIDKITIAKIKNASSGCRRPTRLTMSGVSSPH